MNQHDRISSGDNSSQSYVPECSPALLSLLKLAEGCPDLTSGGARIEKYLYEQYRTDRLGSFLQIYYRLKPLIPQVIRLRMRRQFAKVQERAEFPAWPAEPLLVRGIGAYLGSLAKAISPMPVRRIAFWPHGMRAAFVLTHDVEWEEGLKKSYALAEIEMQCGFRSSWNIVPERYPIDWSIVDRLRSDGFEIGVHGLRHDGKIFESQDVFRKNVVRINDYLREWNAVGFRSESTLRNADWMHAINALYDSSFPDTDPYEPKAGGCCSIWPFFLGDLVELPITLPQDHTLFDILRMDDISIWKEKAEWICDNGGCVLMDVHPDYMTTPSRLKLYESFLRFMKDLKGIWHALPRDVAVWWRERNQSSIRAFGDQWLIDGPAGTRGSVITTAGDISPGSRSQSGSNTR